MLDSELVFPALMVVVVLLTALATLGIALLFPSPKKRP